MRVGEAKHRSVYDRSTWLHDRTAVFVEELRDGGQAAIHSGEALEGITVRMRYFRVGSGEMAPQQSGSKKSLPTTRLAPESCVILEPVSAT
jgi:hypothetical protein